MFQKGTISWRAEFQPIVTLSTTEAEYVALTSASQEAIYLRRLFGSISIGITGPTVLFEDNLSAQALAMRDSNEHSDWTKHIDVRYHFIRQLIKSQQVDIKHISTTHQLAEIFTKDLDKVRFHLFASAILQTGAAVYRR